jgi:DNA translocase ftsK
MLKLLNNPKSDNTRNILNADLFVSNLHNTLKAFGFNPKVTYEVYRSITVYHITWNDDKTYDDILELKKEIALSLGINVSELVMNKVKDNEIFIKVDNMKKDILCLKEVLENYKVDNDFKVVLGLDEYDKLVTFDFDKEKSLLVTGVSGTGKTNLFNDIIMNILINYSNVKVVILDSQGINYNLYNDVCEVVNKEEDIIVKINLLRREFEDRVKNNTRDKMVVFIDEIYEILKLDNSVKDDINYLLEVGSTMGIYLVVSTDSVLEDDTYDLFNKDNVSKISFYLTSRGEYNMFLGKAIRDNFGKDGMYLDNDKNLIRMSIPMVEDDEIERVCRYIKDNK